MVLEAPPHRVRIVTSFEDLLAARFEGDVNALCWPRELPGDFQEILDKLHPDEGITTLQDRDLSTLRLSPMGSVARDVLLDDQAMLRDHGLDPILDCITGYRRDESAGPISTDVYSFHVDSAPTEADTFLCTYIGASSEGLLNEGAIRRVDITETRAELLRFYGGEDDDDFRAYLTERNFDHHYFPLPGSRPYAFGLGNLWRIAIAHPASTVLPCIHRAPLMLPGAPPRLLMIS
jgi:hypothetical protein